MFRLSDFKHWFIVWKFRFDMGYQFMTLLNLALLTLSTVAPLRRFFHIQSTYVLVLVMIVVGIFGVFVFGLFLDQVIRYKQGYNNTEMARNPPLLEIIERLDRIEKKLNGN